MHSNTHTLINLNLQVGNCFTNHNQILNVYCSCFSVRNREISIIGDPTIYGNSKGKGEVGFLNIFIKDDTFRKYNIFLNTTT